MKLFRLIVWKEFQHLRRDPAALRMLLILPMVQLFVLGYALNTEVRNTPIAVLDRCQCPASASLIAAATAPGQTWLHRWQPGDVVMWDNRAVLHRGRPWPDDKPRHMVRTTISATDADGLAELRPAA